MAVQESMINMTGYRFNLIGQLGCSKLLLLSDSLYHVSNSGIPVISRFMGRRKFSSRKSLESTVSLHGSGIRFDMRKTPWVHRFKQSNKTNKRTCQKTGPFIWSEWGDSNSRHLAPKASALPTALHPDMKFSNCGQTCGQRRFLTSYRRGEKCCQPKCPKGFRVFRRLWLEPERHAPKASALPTALHPVMELFYLWSFMWSWPFFDQRLCGTGSRFW